MNLRTVLTIIIMSAAVLIFDLIVNNYLLFHIIAEFFAICILITLFTITWNAKNFLTNGYLIFLGIGGLFIAFLDLMHTLTYKGMNIIPSPVYYANQFWIATRMFESLIILTGFLFLARKKTINRMSLLVLYSIITAGIVLSILVFENFPVCYIENVGQTPFKIYSEFVIIAILLISLFILIRKGAYFEKDIRQFILWSIIFAVISELCFTLYVENYDYINKLGHVFKIMSFFMIFKANVQSGFTRPIDTFFRDLKISEEKIKEYNLELEKQIATKNRFFSILAHDLRNPFTVLLGYTELLLEKFDNLNETERKDIIKTIYETSDETFKLLENLLAWSRTQSNTISCNPSEFDIKELLDDCVLLVFNQAQLKNIELRRDYFNADVVADKDMIMTVIRNLLSNAIKFTRKNGHITIRTELENGLLRISVDDNGIGIPSEKLESLFHVNINHSTRGTENESGIGLGLIICNEFVKMNQSEIRIISEVGKGSSFSFSLPLAQPSQ